MIEERRVSDKGGLCWIAGRLSQMWDWIDKRDIDKHAISVGIFWGTYRLTDWAIAFASASHARGGVEIAAIIAAVTGPYMALQAAAIAFYFKART